MSASDVAGLLVLLGVVGVLAAIVGSGVEAGPVKFPSIPGARQKPLALASTLVIAGGLTWWIVQQHSGDNAAPTSKASQTPAAGSRLRVVLIPDVARAQVGKRFAVRSEVYDTNGQQLGSGQCALAWRDEANDAVETTGCTATFTEPSIRPAGQHHISAAAQGTGGLLASGRGTVDVMVGR
ncbi:MAG: hypothetical protein WAU41_06335 [Gaiellaceae bacterium]